MAALRRTWPELPLLFSILSWGSPQRNDLGLKTVTDPECMSAGGQLTACLTACQKVCSWRRIWAAHLHTYRKNDKHLQPKGTLKNLCFPLIIRFAISLCTSMKQKNPNTLSHQRPSILIACHFRGAKTQKNTHRTDEIWYLLYFLLLFQRRKCSSVLLIPWVSCTGVQASIILNCERSPTPFLLFSNFCGAHGDEIISITLWKRAFLNHLKLFTLLLFTSAQNT